MGTSTCDTVIETILPFKKISYNITKMSYCKQEGKDKVMFMTPEDLAAPSSITFPDESDPPGLVLPNGEINWSCPCLGGMATGPCGVEFREAFTCFHYSEAEPKGSECFDSFKKMQECMAEYPAIYGKEDQNEESVSEEKSEDTPALNKESSNVEETKSPS